MRRDCIKITNQNYKIKNGQLRISIRAREFIYIKLEKHTIEMLKGFKHGGLTITPTVHTQVHITIRQNFVQLPIIMT